jgi:membrane associated rhomboid family serine protease
MFPLANTAKEKGPAAITKLLVAANLAVFGWEAWLALGQGAAALDGFVTTHALVPARLLHAPLDPAQWQTIFTHLFLHGGIVHVLGNVWFLWVFGGNVEGRIGAFRFLLLYLLGGVAAAGAQILSSPFSTVTMVGASGAISAVLGAYLFLFPTAFVWTLVPWIVPILPVPAVVFLVLWFLLQAYNGLGSVLSGTSGQGGVAWWAHAGGFAAGAAMIWWAKSAGWIRRR